MRLVRGDMSQGYRAWLTLLITVPLVLGVAVSSPAVAAQSYRVDTLEEAPDDQPKVELLDEIPAGALADPPESTIPAMCKPAAYKIPAWMTELAQINPAEAKKTADSEYYRQWRQTSTSDCTNISQIQAQNPQLLPPIWRKGRNILFRGGNGRSVDYVFQHGFEPWKHDGSLIIPSGVANKNSAITNSGYNPFSTFKYGVPAGGHGYVIDAPGGLEQTLMEGKSSGEKAIVLFPGGINTKFIKGVFFKENRTGPLKFMPNPNFAGSTPKNDEFDIIGVHHNVDLRLETSSGGHIVGPNTTRFKLGTTVTLSAPQKNGIPVKGKWTINGTEKGTSEKFTLSPAEQYLQTIIVLFNPA